MRKMARRDFIRAAACSTLALSTLRASAQATSPNHFDALSVEPGKMPRLFTGLCAYSYRQALLGGQMKLEDFIQRAVDLKVDGVDMTVYYLHSTDPAYLAHLRNVAYRAGMPLSGAACRAELVQANAAGRDAALADVKKWVDVADRLGASHLRIFGGIVPKGAAPGPVLDGVVEIFKAAADYSGQKGIVLGIENHSGVTQSADVCLDIMHRVNHPYAGINLDLTHFLPAETSYDQIAACLPYATNVHVRDKFDDNSPIDMDRVWRMFVAAGFKGYMSIEFSDATESAATGIPRLVTEVKALNKKYSSV